MRRWPSAITGRFQATVTSLVTVTHPCNSLYALGRTPTGTSTVAADHATARDDRSGHGSCSTRADKSLRPPSRPRPSSVCGGAHAAALACHRPGELWRPIMLASDNVRLHLTAGMKEFIDANAAWLTVFGRWHAWSGVELDQGIVRWLATQAGLGPDRNVYEWPSGLARRGTWTGVVAKAVESTGPDHRCPIL